MLAWTPKNGASQRRQPSFFTSHLLERDAVGAAAFFPRSYPWVALTVRKSPTSRVKEFRTVLRLAPANRDGNYNLGLVLMAKGLPAEAISHFQRVRPANVETRFNLIRAFFQARRTAEGLKVATEF